MSGKLTSYRYTLILIAAVTAVILLTLSWQRLRASLRFLPVDTAISNFRENQEVDNTQLEGLIERAGETIAIHDHYRYWDVLSELQILSSQDRARSFWERRQALNASIAAAEVVVQHAPAKPRTWLRIARAREYLTYPPEQVIPALKSSILAGRVEPTLMLTRLELGLRFMHQLDTDTKRMLRDQAVLTWTIQPKPMLQRIKTGELTLPLLRELLTTSNQAIISEIETHFDE